jgi:hypothetical protein
MKNLRRSVSLAVLFAGVAFSGMAVAADTSFYLEPCTDPATGCEPGDLDLARWALDSWQKASQGKLHFIETKDQANALFRFVWSSPEGGLFGETVPIDVHGKPGARIYIVNQTRGISDHLLRDTIVYLTCLHESGHALGLSHTDQFADIMYYFGYGGDINEYFGRYRRKLVAREDIRNNPGLSAADVRRLLIAIAER